jgi:lipid-binding SYLF domain-containing protein
VAGPRFAEREHIDDKILANPVLVYTRNKGLFAGISVKSGWFARNDDATDALYNTTFTLPEILYSDWLQAPADVVPLVNLVKSLAP